MASILTVWTPARCGIAGTITTVIPCVRMRKGWETSVTIIVVIRASNLAPGHPSTQEGWDVY